MRRDPSVCLMGEDVGVFNGVWGAALAVSRANRGNRFAAKVRIQTFVVFACLIAKSQKIEPTL